MQFKSRLVFSFALLLFSSTAAVLYLCHAKSSKLNDVPNDCQTVHIAFVVGGYNATRGLAAILKSILFHRHNPLHLHIIVDSPAKLIVDELMKTWMLPSLKYTLYPLTDDLIEEVEWIPNAHYSSIFGLLKVLLPKILPIDSVIVLDTDMIVLSDIAQLWQHLVSLRRGGKWLGLVENQSEWYRGTIWKEHRPWPALGNGFNTGTMLLDLSAMRNAGWDLIWTKVTTEALKEHKYTSLADQDIINAVIKMKPETVYTLPCNWNIQLGDHTHSDDCFMRSNQHHIIHWNSQLKTQLDNGYAPYFRNIHNTFLQYDGNFQRQDILRCHNDADPASSFQKSSSKSSFCSLFIDEAKKYFRTHLYYFGEKYTAFDEHDVTLITQLSIDRIQNVEILLRHWEGPITLVLYCTDSDLYQFLHYIESFPVWSKRFNVALHVVYKQGEFYPVNLLRNVGLRYSNTPYVFLTDIDFLPMFNLYNYLREAVRVLQLNVFKRALVIPAFEFLQYKNDFPQSKSTLLKLLQQGKGVQEFRHTVWHNGHLATNYEKWYKASHPYKIQWQLDFEPYIAVNRNVTEYDDRFMGFGWNKVSHILELYSQGYEFIVLPDAFIIHSPHSPSPDVNRYRSHKHYRQCLNELKGKFIAELVDKYGAEAEKYKRVYINKITLN